MFAPEGKHVWVIGLGASGLAAAELLRARGAVVCAVDHADTPALRLQAERLKGLGIPVTLGVTPAPEGACDLAVISPGVPLSNPLVESIRRRRVPILSELELGWQQSFCPAVAITGTNGKTTTTELIEGMLRHNHLRTMAAGNIGLPVCAVAARTKELDFLTIEVSSFQLETTQQFRPVVGVLTNITPDHLDRYASLNDYARAKGRLFMNQQPFDWAVVQSAALAELRRVGVTLQAKVITYSATDRQADLHLERGLMRSRLPDWSGPLLDLERTRLRGPHNAENLMAALAVGRALRLPLEGMVEALCRYQPAPHRCELVAEVRGVKYINDSKATNVDAVAKALLAVPPGPDTGQPNVWLLAGGKDKGFEFHELGPLLAQRVKGAFVFGETRQRICAAWSLFTACAQVGTLLEAIAGAAAKAVPGDVILLSPACSSFDQFQDYQHRGEVFRQAVQALAAPGLADSVHPTLLEPCASAPAVSS